MSIKGLLAAFCAASVIFLIAAPCPGFNVETRDALVVDAIEFCPQELRMYLLGQREAVKSGMFFSDTADLKVNPKNIPELYQTLIERIESDRLDEYNTATLFGVLANHIAETVYPGHQNSSQNLAPDIVSYDGYHPVEDPDIKSYAIMKSYEHFHGSRTPEVSDRMYEISVNLIVDFWMSAWAAAGMSIDDALPFGEEVAHDARMQ
ncbi:MAG: hypothetical protein ACLFOY_15230 [Desulfatibacillaceae bacterium]